ncbi:hypothetical protein AYO44_02135 [Planctomycetaceae bacterium SCGC AG-212-F19]|nr:hypothetical protein AYO44_02135 [Planctomycetaceae bacterium SCGC AG-212-F19]
MYTRLRYRCLFLLALGFLGAAAIADEKPAVSSVADADLAAFVQKRVADWQPTADERRFDEIGWAKSVLDGERLAKEHNRPLFWFTHDGKMSVGRC